MLADRDRSNLHLVLILEPITEALDGHGSFDGDPVPGGPVYEKIMIKAFYLVGQPWWVRSRRRCSPGPCAGLAGVVQ